MKTIYSFLLAATLVIGSTSCNSDEPMDASSKHVYAENEAPYLRTVAGANAVVDIEIPVMRIDQPVTIDLKKYSSYFHKNLNMTVDEALAAYDAGEVVFYNVNSAKGRWDLTPSTLAGATGWCYNSYNAIVGADQGNFSVELDRTAKKLYVKAINNPIAGTLGAFSVGFAVKNGKDFDNYMRFSINTSVTDPTIVTFSGAIPAGTYTAVGYDFRKCEGQLIKCFGMTAKQFIAAIDNEEITTYLMKDGKRRTKDDDGITTLPSTAGYLGWWMDENLDPVNWNGSGYPANFVFTEYGGDGVYNFGRPAGVPAGTKTTITVDFALKSDLNSHITLIASLVFE